MTGDAGAIDPLEAFAALDLRVGTVVAARPNEGARVPAMHLEIDFGPLGLKHSSAQLHEHHRPEELVGRQVIAAVNLGTRRIASVRSEVLVLGLPDEDGATILLGPDRPVPDGGRVH